MSDHPTAAELDAQIRALAAQRAATPPGHPVEPPVDPARMFRADNMLWHVRPAPDAAALEIALYHPGLGWTGILMSRAQIEDLQDCIADALRRMPVRFNGANTP
jgi:hypothetical protein